MNERFTGDAEHHLTLALSHARQAIARMKLDDRSYHPGLEPHTTAGVTQLIAATELVKETL